MPSHEHLDPLINLVNQATLTSAKLDSLYRITHDRQRLNDIAAWNNRTWFASVDLCWGITTRSCGAATSRSA